MKICLTTKYSPFDWKGGGMSISVHYYAEELVKQGHNVDVIYTYFGKNHPPFKANYKIHWVKQDFFWDYIIKIPFYFKKINKKKNFDIVHSNGPEGLFIPFIFKKKYFFMTSHQAVIYNLGIYNLIKDFFKNRYYCIDKLWLRFELEMEKKACMASAKVISVSNHFRNELSNKYGISKKKILVLYNGINTKKFEYYFNKVEDKINLLFVGRICSVKGMDVLLKEYNKLRRKHNHLYLTFVGEGNKKLFYKKTCKKLNLKKVKFMNHISQEDLIELMHKNHILIVPSYHENCPLIVLEGMSAGIPIIASGVGGIPELITSGKEGILFNPLIPGSLYESINLLIEKDRMRKELSIKARKKVEEFSWAKNSNLLINAYKKTIKEVK